MRPVFHGSAPLSCTSFFTNADHLIRGPQLREFRLKVAVFRRILASNNLVKDLRNEATNLLPNQEECKMAKYEQAIIGDMVLFLDALMSRLDPKIAKLNKAKKKKFILKFFKYAGLIKLGNHRRSGGVWKFSYKFYDEIERGRPSRGKDYEFFLGNCVGPQGLELDWFHFVDCLVTIFSLEYKLFFEWLLVEIKIIKLGLRILSSHGLTGKAKADAISFTLAVLMAIYGERCLRHCASLIKRETKRKAKRQRRLAEQFSNINTSSATEQLSTKVATNSSEAVLTPGRPDTIDAVDIGAFDGKAQSANLPSLTELMGFP
jgi:hypothetical protein